MWTDIATHAARGARSTANRLSAPDFFASSSVMRSPNDSDHAGRGPLSDASMNLASFSAATGNALPARMSAISTSARGGKPCSGPNVTNLSGTISVAVQSHRGPRATLRLDRRGMGRCRQHAKRGRRRRAQHSRVCDRRTAMGPPPEAQVHPLRFRCSHSSRRWYPDRHLRQDRTSTNGDNTPLLHALSN